MSSSGMRGDVDFERLVDQHYASLYRFALSLSGTESDACDLVQETFYVWAAKGHQLTDVSKVKSWLFTTLHREFLARERRRVRFPHHPLEDVTGELPEVDLDLPAHVDAQAAAECLARVDPAFKAAVALFYLEDYSYNEIAAVLGIPLGTVKSRIARGVAQLKQMLRERAAPQPSSERKAP